MELTPEQENAIARLYENESLTENLTDQDAQALLEWAQGQIVANTDDALVRAAVSAANSSGEQGVQTLVTRASTFLAQELGVRDAAAARSTESPAASVMGDRIANSAPPGTDELTRQDATDNSKNEAATARSIESPSASAMGESNSAALVPTTDELTGRAVAHTDARLQASASAAEQNTLSAAVSGNIGSGSSPSTLTSKPKRKKPRKSKRSKKK